MTETNIPAFRIIYAVTTHEGVRYGLTQLGKPGKKETQEYNATK